MRFNPDGTKAGTEFRVYKNRLSALCLREPHKYHALKGFITEKIEQDLVSDIYKIVFNLMSAGKFKGGNPIIVPTDYEGNTSGQTIPLGAVKYPHNKINNAALSLVNTIMGELETIIETILPSDYTKLANSRLHIGGSGKAVDI